MFITITKIYTYPFCTSAGKRCEEPALTENCGPQLSEAQETILPSNCGSDVPSNRGSVAHNISQEDLVKQKDEIQCLHLLVLHHVLSA